MNDHHYAPGASPLITGRAPDDDPADTQQRHGDSSPRNGGTPPRNDATPPRSGATHQARADTAPPARASDGHAGEHGTPARGGVASLRGGVVPLRGDESPLRCCVPAGSSSGARPVIRGEAPGA